MAEPQSVDVEKNDVKTEEGGLQNVANMKDDKTLASGGNEPGASPAEAESDVEDEKDLPKHVLAPMLKRAAKEHKEKIELEYQFDHQVSARLRLVYVYIYILFSILLLCFFRSKH